jgi:PTH2 family peptidyl-tRNA hydrolase
MGIKQVIVVRKDLNMRKGKIAAQVAHASMKFLSEKNSSKDPAVMNIPLTPAEVQWFSEGFAKIVVSVNSAKELGELVHKARREGIQVSVIIDSGKTEFHGVPTMTCASFGPDESEKLDQITGTLPLM